MTIRFAAAASVAVFALGYAVRALPQSTPPVLDPQKVQDQQDMT